MLLRGPLLALSLLAVHALCIAQQPRFTRFGLKDGLPALKIYALAQDSAKDLWVGTASGLARFDGSEFHTYYSEAGDPRSLALNVVSDLYCDHQGGVWISTGEHLQKYCPATDDYERIGTPRMLGYIRFTALSPSRMLIHDVRDVYAMDLVSHRTTALPFIHQAIGTQLMYMHADGERTLWVGASNGLWKADLNARSIARVHDVEGLLDKPFTAEHVSRIDAERLLITSWGSGFFIFNTRTGICTRHATGTTNNISYGCLAERAGRIWIGTDDGALLYDALKDRAQPCVEESGDPGTLTHGLYEVVLRDHEGSIWFGGSAGLMKWDVLANSVVVSALPSSENLRAIESNVVSMVPLSPTSTLIGSYLGIHLVENGKVLPVMEAKGTTAGGTRFYLFPGHGNVLAAVQGELLELDTSQRPITSKGRLTLSGTITAAAALPDGDIIIGTSIGGLVRIDHTSFGEPMKINCAGLPARPVLKLELYNDQWLAVNYGSHGAVVDLRRNKAEVFSAVPDSTIAALHVIPVQQNFFSSVGFSGDGHLLIGTLTNSLLMADRALNTVADLRQRFPSLHRTVQRVLPVSGDRYWLTTPMGLQFLDLVSGNVRSFGSSYGASEDQDALCATLRDGAVVQLMGDRSLMIGAPTISLLPPQRTSITGLWANGDRVTMAPELSFAADKNHIRVAFASTSFALHTEKRFAYRMLGGSGEWTDTDGRNEVTFENLAPGEYALEVRGTDAQGITDPHVARIAFRIAQPFQRTWWFIGLIALVPLVLLALLFRIRIVRLQESQRVRDRIAKDLHDDLGSSMSAIGIYGRVLEERLGGASSELGTYASSIRQASASASESIADIVWAEDPSKDQFIHTATRIRSHFLELVEAADIQGSIHIDPDLNHASLEGSKRRDLFLIYKEAVNNALKHSACASLDVKIERTPNGSRMTVRDDGHGFDPTSATRVNGTRNMQQRAAAQGGWCVVESAEGRGTTVRVELPVGR